MAYIWRILGLLTLCLCASAQATSLRYLNLQQLVDASDLVIRGRPVHQESFWQNKRILTRVRIAVDEVWVGRIPASREVEVLTLGGTVDGIGQRVDGAAILPLGQEIVLQLTHGRDHALWPVALAQGVWMLEMDDSLTNGLSCGPVHIARPFTDRLVATSNAALQPMPQTVQALKTAILEAAHGR